MFWNQLKIEVSHDNFNFFSIKIANHVWKGYILLQKVCWIFRLVCEHWPCFICFLCCLLSYSHIKRVTLFFFHQGVEPLVAEMKCYFLVLTLWPFSLGFIIGEIRFMAAVNNRLHWPKHDTRLYRSRELVELIRTH